MTLSAYNHPGEGVQGRIVPRTILEHAGHVQPCTGPVAIAFLESGTLDNCSLRNWAPACAGVEFLALRVTL